MSTADPDPGRQLDLAGADLRWWPRLLTQEQARHCFDALVQEVPWRQQSIAMFGRRIPEPRLVSWHGDDGAAYRYSGRENAPLPWTPALAQLRQIAQDVTGAAFNSVLANLYRDGADHLGWHADDETELGSRPVIASWSLGGTRKIQFRPRPRGPIALELPLTSGSLLVMAGETQRGYHHRIPATARPVPARINLTFRWVGTRDG